MKKRHAQQCDVTFYRKTYMTLQRMVAHWHQANEVAEITPKSGRVLEIGPGSGHTTWLLKQWGLDVTTLDYDKSVSPDLLGDVTKIPCNTGAFDCVLAAEVLEHLPFEEFGASLAELRRVSRGYIIVTLPAPFLGLSALINLPGVRLMGISLGLSYFIHHRFDGAHYWELGKQGYSKRRIRRVIRETGLTIVKEYRPAPSLYCYCFVMRIPKIP
ncbi:MAG: class I SAM-dependent methyltransferase [Chlamydiota bacterium]|nr:class I SAM-dependent methyltransferase [Chlamydiota bacterium]